MDRVRWREWRKESTREIVAAATGRGFLPHRKTRRRHKAGSQTCGSTSACRSCRRTKRWLNRVLRSPACVALKLDVVTCARRRWREIPSARLEFPQEGATSRARCLLKNRPSSCPGSHRKERSPRRTAKDRRPQRYESLWPIFSAKRFRLVRALEAPCRSCRSQCSRRLQELGRRHGLVPASCRSKQTADRRRPAALFFGCGSKRLFERERIRR